MELTQEEKQFIIEVLSQVNLNYQASQLRESVIQKLQVTPVPAVEEEKQQ